MKCDGTCAETRFRLSKKRTSPFKSAGGVSSVDYWQPRCAHQLAGFVLLVQACVLQSCDGYWLPTPFSCLPFTSPPVRHRVPSHFNWTIHTIFSKQALCLVGVHIPPNTLIIVCAETRFRLSAKRTSPFKSAGASVQSTTGRRAVHISLQGLYCSCKPVFCSHVTLTGYPLHCLVSPSLLLPCVTVCHHISTGLYTQSSRSRPTALWVCTFRPTH